MFLTQLDGIYAASLADLRIVASKGANTMWYSTIHAAAVDNQTIAQFLMASGMAWTMRGAIEDNTANGDFGAFMGLARGIEGRGHSSRLGRRAIGPRPLHQCQVGRGGANP